MSKYTDLIDNLSLKISTITPSQCAEQYRIITSGSEHKGRFSYNLTPYMREPVDRLSQADPTRTIVIMGGSQLGKSHGYIFNGMLYIIKEAPGDIFFTCGSDELVRNAMGKIDEMIASSGLRHLIRPTVSKKSNQKTGDTDTEKQFVGGRLFAQSIMAVDKIKQDSYRYIFLDDIENANKITAKNVGDIIELARTRATSFSDSYKLSAIGVPELKNTSIIEPAYLRGDQRHYMMPCPCCGERITYVWRELLQGETDKYAGVTYQIENGRLIESSVGYTCQKCGGFFKENHKTEMLANGVWQPTAIASENYYHSYHLPALLAPRGFFSWTNYAQQWINIFPQGGVTDEKKLQHFINHVLAKTYEIRKREVSAAQISRNLRQYDIGQVPNKLAQADGKGQIIILTCACDLNGFEDDARLDYEVLAHCKDGTTYSIDAGSIGTFDRGVSKENREAWTYRHGVARNVWGAFKEIITKDYADENGEVFKIAITGIDTGAFTTLAYEFLNRGITGRIMVGLKGAAVNKNRKLDADTKTFQRATERPDLFWVEGNFIKDELSELMKLEFSDEMPMPAGFMNYPWPSQGKYDNKYFIEYEGEVRKPVFGGNGLEIGFAWEKQTTHSPNHFWDCRVYNRCLRDIFVDILSKSAKKPMTWQQFCESVVK